MDVQFAEGSKNHPYDVLIIGAGVVGSAAAVAFARQGRSVLLLERNLKEPDRIVGELLQPGGVAALENLGLRGCLEGIDAIPVKGYEIYYRGESITFFYPPVCVTENVQDSREAGGQNSEPAVATLPEEFTATNKRPEGRSFRHGRFVKNLRMEAAREEKVKVVEATAKELVRNGDKVIGVKCLAGDKTEQIASHACSLDPFSAKAIMRRRNRATSSSRMLPAVFGFQRFSFTNSPDSTEDSQLTHPKYFSHLTIVVDGQASNFRSHCHNRKPISRSRFWGLELIDAKLPNYAHAYGVIGSGPPVLIYQIGTRETRILIDVPDVINEAASATGGVKEYIRSSVIPTLPKTVQPAVETALKMGRLRSMPNSWLPADLNQTAGLLLLGDAMNMRHPLTGGGMTVGLDVVLVSQLLNPQIVPSFQDRLFVLKQTKSFHSQRKAHSMSLKILAQALYTLFLADGVLIASPSS
ncbi:Squalene monooxygenase [Lachnellula arida]|uniref:Squalene monooxygenase n=1 Tax=Lachnellula arida TaxID=1316785 RepID=A0A8T9BM27_9HELO|nr:Squalene monooxygenase [Lachnellula arida]